MRARARLVEGSARRDHAKVATPRRFGRAGYFTLLAVLALAVVSLVLAGPVKRNLQASSELRARQQELEAERQETRELQERRDRALQTDFVIEQARRLGYVMRGEVPVIVVREGEEGNSPEHHAQE